MVLQILVEVKLIFINCFILVMDVVDPEPIAGILDTELEYIHRGWNAMPFMFLEGRRKHLLFPQWLIPAAFTCAL